MQHFSRTRIAPTPSGFLHIGNAFSFALTAALACEAGAGILLRIDDMDSGRVQPEYIGDIFETLRFLDIPWTEGPKDAADFNRRFSQHLRLPLYKDALKTLADSGKVYACTCSRAGIRSRHGGIYPGTCRRKNIPLDAPDAAWRIDTEGAPPISVRTPAGTKTENLPESMRHFIVRKKDGFPAYQLASLIDDVHFGIDLVVRGEDLWPSTLAQLFLAGIVGQRAFSDAVFFHHPLIRESSGRKLSKSAGDTSVRFLRQSGMAAADVYAQIGSAFGIRARDWRDFAALVRF
jgi:glutamyl-tRNA synthetase